MPTVKGVFENLIAGGALAVILLVGTWATDTIDTPVPLWLLILSSVVVLVVGFSVGKLTRDHADLPAYQADLVGEAILALRDHAAGRLAVPLSDLVELGILAPARYGLSVVRGEEIRLSVVEPDELSQARFDGDLEARIPPGGRGPINPRHDRRNTPKSCSTAGPGWFSTPAARSPT